MRACVQFEGVSEKPKYYENPLHILKAETIDEVKDVMRAAERFSADYTVIGYLTYEAAAAYSPYMKTKTLPLYAAFYVFDEETKPFADEPFDEVSFAFNETKDEIMRKIDAVQQQIREGNTYQANLTTRLSAVSDCSYGLYQHLTQHNNGRYTAYIEDGEDAVISISPELFFQRAGDVITTKPMKGTIARMSDPKKDKAHYELLKNSAKDRAENVMIVDLLRNDLSKIAAKNSVAVPELFEVTPYYTVYQMTSTITAEVPGQSLDDVLTALFPCGSITGAPKISTMAIIDTLEDEPRGVYCGAIGVMTKDKQVFSVPIRTIEKHGTHLSYGAGGGITIGSEREAEFDEMVAKTSILKALKSSNLHPEILMNDDFHLIETMYIDEEGIKRKTYHQKRLKRSLEYFNMRYNAQLIDELLDKTHPPAMYRLEAYDGYIKAEIKSLPQQRDYQAKLMEMSAPLDLLQHKTSKRAHYTAEEGFLSLYYNAAGYVTEFNIGNFVYKLGGKLYTPETAEQLPGCMQAELLAEGQITRRDLHKNDLKNVEIFMVNSLRGMVPVTLSE